METEEERKKVLTISQADEVGLLLCKVRALALLLNKASAQSYLNSNTITTLTTDMVKSLDKIEATLGI